MVGHSLLLTLEEPTCASADFLPDIIPDDLDSRVCEVHLKGDKTFTLRQQKYKVSDALKTGEASVLFGATLEMTNFNSSTHHCLGRLPS